MRDTVKTWVVLLCVIVVWRAQANPYIEPAHVWWLAGEDVTLTMRHGVATVRGAFHFKTRHKGSRFTEIIFPVYVPDTLVSDSAIAHFVACRARCQGVDVPSRVLKPRRAKNTAAPSIPGLRVALLAVSAADIMKRFEERAEKSVFMRKRYRAGRLPRSALPKRWQRFLERPFFRLDLAYRQATRGTPGADTVYYWATRPENVWDSEDYTIRVASALPTMRETIVSEHVHAPESGPLGTTIHPEPNVLIVATLMPRPVHWVILAACILLLGIAAACAATWILRRGSRNAHEFSS